MVYFCPNSDEPRHDTPAEPTYSASPLTEKTRILNDALFRAASRGHGEKIRDFIHNGADANADQNGTTLLIKSAMRGTVPVTKILLSMKGIKVNCRNHAGQSALWCAAYHGNFEIVRLLLEKKDIQIDCNDESGFTPLAIAAVGEHPGHTRVVKLLLAKGANTKARDTVWHMTPKSWAERVGNVDTINALRNFQPEPR